ncbi:hypothetical protein FRC06_009525 [Ceratobasidium sp. 370]|nr:hypothetical protein FRC06_009525 [Ceratobasidium sp. 370]
MRKGRERRRWKSMVNVLPQFNFLAFDITGDLAFGTSFGMIAAQCDITPIFQLSPSSSAKTQDATYIPAIKIFNDRGSFSASMGVLPPWVREWVLLLPR